MAMDIEWKTQKQNSINVDEISDESVSYTHLDVYKRQVVMFARSPSKVTVILNRHEATRRL